MNQKDSSAVNGAGARIGQELDYDKLSLSVETDGTVTPEDAVAYAGPRRRLQFAPQLQTQHSTERAENPQAQHLCASAVLCDLCVNTFFKEPYRSKS
jgi:DNA-directed RNA polymerase alpha subunit